jgi:hypothetical protein
LYYHTLTKDAFLTSGSGILQLLRPDHKHLVPILGKHSGYDTKYKKQLECEKMGYPWVSSLTSVQNNKQQEQSTVDTSSTLNVLPNCATYIHVKIVQSNDESTTLPAGDHVVVFCEVLGTFQWNDTTHTISTISSHNNSTTYIPSFDATTVLYTGQLRQEGII